MVMHKLKYLPDGEPDYNAPIPPSPPGKTLEQCEQICAQIIKQRRNGNGLADDAPSYCFHRQRALFLRGDTAAHDVDAIKAEYNAAGGGA